MPRIVDGTWQANQSLQVFMPMYSRDKAEEILNKLNASQIEQYLLSMNMKGTQNWAQPGKIKKLLRFIAPDRPEPL